jgi:hypothetical protein
MTKPDKPTPPPPPHKGTKPATVTTPKLPSRNPQKAMDAALPPRNPRRFIGTENRNDPKKKTSE